MKKNEIEALAYHLREAKIVADKAVANLRDDGPCCNMSVVLTIPNAKPQLYEKLHKLSELDYWGRSFSFCKAQGDVERVANLAAFTYLIDVAGEYEWTLEYMPD